MDTIQYATAIAAKIQAELEAGSPLKPWHQLVAEASASTQTEETK